jgi:hypothetical protein
VAVSEVLVYECLSTGPKMPLAEYTMYVSLIQKGGGEMGHQAKRCENRDACFDAAEARAIF